MGTETVFVEPFLPGGRHIREESEDDTDEDDHEDIELMVKEMAALKKVCGEFITRCLLSWRWGKMFSSPLT